MLKVLDLFSGIGGFSLGLERTGGFETVAFCEMDRPCQLVLKKHWPNTHIFGDVKGLYSAVGGLIDHCSDVFVKENIDVICGGFPCQDISVAGKGEGIEGSRSGLWKEFHRLIKEISPRWAIIENVANLRGRGLNQVIKDLWKIGYDCEWHIISARSVGAIHLRERIWIVAYPKIANPNNVRLWRSFTTEKEKSEWWSKATSSFRSVLKKVSTVKPTVCRVDDGISKIMDKARRERIKQLGNSVVPQIPELIGNMILRYEEDECQT